MTNRTSPARSAARTAAALALAAAILAPQAAQAAITQPTAWTSEYANTGYPSGSVGSALNIAAGSGRVLVVAIASRTSTAAAQTVTVSWGGQSLSLAQGDGTQIGQQHTYLYYLNDAGITAATNNSNLNVTVTGGTAAYTWVYAAVYAGVNQSTPFTNTQTSTSLSTASGTVAFATGLTENANDQPIEVILLQRNASGGTARTISNWAASWGTNGGTLPVNVQYNDGTFYPQLYISQRAVPASTTTDTSSHTLSSTSSYWSMTGLSLQTAPAGTITLGNNTGTDATPATICAAPAAATYIDFFTLQASASGTNVNTITTTFSPTIPAGLLSLLEVTSDTGTSQGSLANPSGTNPAVSGMSFAAPTARTQYRLRITPNAAATTSGTFTATVTGVTNSAGFTVSGTDTSSATIVVDGQASPDVTAASATGTAGTVTASWTNPPAGAVPATDFGSYVVVLGNTVAITGVPTEGTLTYPVNSTIGADTVVCSGNVPTCAKAGLGASQPYYLKVFTRDACANWSAGVQVNATTPAAPTTTIADGTNPPNVTQLAPGGAETPLDAFTFASPGPDTVTSVTVTLAAGTGAAVQRIRVMSGATCTGTQYFTAVTNPPGDVVSLSGGTSIPVTATATPYYVCITPKAYASLAPPPGQVYAVTGTVTAFTNNGTNTKAGTDAASATVNIDDASSPDVTTASAVGGSGMVTASWTNPGAGTAPATDFGGYVVVLGNTVAVTNTPVDGTGSYTTNTTIGADTVICQGSITTCQRTGLSVGQAYFMKIFTRDLVNNWSAGVAVSASAQDARTTPVSLSGAAAGCTAVNLSASYSGDSNSSNTVTFTRGTDGVSFATTICSAVAGGTNPRTCTDSTVSPSATYYYRATFADGDGIVGAATKDSGAVAVGGCGLSVVAGAMPPGANVAAGSSGTLVGRYTLTPSGSVALSSLSVSNTGSAVAGADVASLALFDVTGATTVFVGAAAWNSTTAHWDFSSLGYKVTAPVTLAVALNVGKGATTGRTFVLNTNVPADVAVAAPATVSNSTTIAGNPFPIVGGTPSGNKAANAPMVSIQNPANGKVVSGAFKVQIRVFNEERSNGAPGVTVTLSTDNGTTYPTAAAANTKYDAIDPTFAPTVTGRSFEAQLSLPIGSYTLRAKAVNAVPATTYSEPVQITVAASGKGDGNLLVRDDSSQLCSDCHALKTHSTEAVGNTYGAWAVNCRDCHSPHRTRDIHLVSELILPPSVAGTTLPAANVGYVTQTGAITGNGWAGSGPTSTATFVNQGDSSGPCQVCHTRTQNPGTGAARWRRQGNADTHYTVAAGTAPCTGCHSHVNGFAPGESTGGSSCASCHSQIWNLMNGTTSVGSKHQLGSVLGTNDSPNDNGQLWAPQSALTVVTPSQRSCVNMCHGDHPHDLTSPLVSTHDYNLYLDPSSATSRANGTAARTQANRANEDFDPVSNTGLCVRCHTQPIVTGGITVSGASYGVSAHDYVSNVVTTTAVTYTWQYTLHKGVTQRNCTKCHASRTEGTTPSSTASGSSAVAVHGTADDSLLAGSKNPAGTVAGFVCYNCHGSTQKPSDGTQGNRSNRDVQTDLAKANAHPANQDAVHNTVAEASTGYNSGKFATGSARHSSCLDCHDPHKAGSNGYTFPTTGTMNSTRNQIPAGSPLTGALGVTYGPTYPALWTASTSANFGASLAPITYEYQLCFKCHTSFAFGTTPPTGPSGLAETDLAQEFSPNNASGHPVVTGLANYGGYTPHPVTATYMNAPWNAATSGTTGVGQQTMTCSDCHNTDAANPVVNGPHGSAVTFMLSGTNRTWPGTFTISSYNTSSGTAAGLFCLNCHKVTATNGAHRDGHHSSQQCTACHILIPHGGKVSRLILTANAPARYKNPGVTPVLNYFRKSTNGSYQTHATGGCSATCDSSIHPTPLTGSNVESW
jgi:hypothetical protein